MVQDAAAQNYVNNCKSDAKNKYDPLFRNALDAVNDFTTLPVMLQYSGEFVKQPDGRVQKLSAPDLFTDPDIDPVHYPNFGLALYWRYVDLGINRDDRRMKLPQVGVGKVSQFAGWLPVVQGWMVP